ncbi:hypothetical protein SLEP1_g19101 [Rubroshorea leprosula]|nr:hypothetical protein SLEP1_g19101 [Rubroshorea leprosula]
MDCCFIAFFTVSSTVFNCFSVFCLQKNKTMQLTGFLLADIFIADSFSSFLRV